MLDHMVVLLLGVFFLRCTYLFTTVLGLRCCTWTLFAASEVYAPVAVRRLLAAVDSLIAPAVGHVGISSCGRAGSVVAAPGLLSTG